MSRVTKCLSIVVASTVGAGWAYDANRHGLVWACVVLAAVFFIGLLPAAAEADAVDRFRR